MIRSKLLIILLILGSSLIFPEKYSAQTDFSLILRKKKKRIHYFEQNTIEIKLKDTGYIGTLHNIQIDSCLLDSAWIKYQDIHKIIDRSRRHFIKNGSIKFPIAGVTFALLTALNAIIHNERPIFLREHLIPSAGLVGLGAVMFPFRNKKYNLKRNWQIIVIPE